MEPISEEEVAVMVEKTQEISRKNKWDKTKHQNSETNIIDNPNALNDPSGQKRIKIVKMRADRDQNPDGSCSKVDCKKRAEAFQENLITVVQNTSKVKNDIIENIVAEASVNYELQKNYPSNNKTSSMRNSLSAELCAELCQSAIFTGKSKIKPKVRRNIRQKMKPKTAR